MSGINPVNVSEFQMVSSRVAKVILNCAADIGTDLGSLITDAVHDKFQGRASVIANSFSWLRTGSSMFGYIASTRVTREADPEYVRSNYRVLASNIYMDKNDQTLWEMKKGVGGSYLARQDHDDLSSLIESARVSPRGSTPRMSSVITASAAPKEFVAFVHDSGYSMPAVEYGFCLTSKGLPLRVLSFTTKSVVEVQESSVVSTHEITSSELQSAMLTSKKITAADTSTLSMEDYYRRAYGYAPEYVEMIIKQIQEMRAL